MRATKSDRPSMTLTQALHHGGLKESKWCWRQRRKPSGGWGRWLAPTGSRCGTTGGRQLGSRRRDTGSWWPGCWWRAAGSRWMCLGTPPSWLKHPGSGGPGSFQEASCLAITNLQVWREANGQIVASKTVASAMCFFHPLPQSVSLWEKVSPSPDHLSAWAN